MRRGVAVTLAAALPVALAGTRFHLVPAADALWRGVTDPPGFARLFLGLALGVCVAVLVERRAARAATPLLFLGLASLPIIPLLTGRLPLLLLFQGPLLVVLASAVVAVALERTLAARAAPRFTLLSDPALFAIGLVFYLCLGLFLPGPAGPQGDEPHYLVMTQSLLRDADLDLQNQFRERQYAAFFAGTLEPHTSPAGPPGRIYSIHTPGLSALLLPAFAAFGYPGARAFMSVLAALTGVLTYRLLRESLGSPGLALFAWAALTFTPPLPFYALAIYPEVAAALATALFLLASRRAPAAPWIIGVSASAAVLPWLHPKFLPLAALGLLLTLLRPCSWSARAAAIAALLVSLGLLLFYFQRLYGAPSLSAAYGPGFAGDVTLAHVPHGVLGILLDRQFGLLAVQPLWAIALPGAVALVSRRTGDALRALLLSVASLGVGASFSMWWGGSCPPARFIVPALPPLALCLALAVQRRRGLSAALFGIGLACVAIAALAPRALHNRADGESALLRVLAPALDLDASLPSFVGKGGDPALLLTATAAAAGALAWSLGTRGVLAGGLAYLLLAGALRERPLVDARAAALELLARWDETNVRGVGGALEPSALRIPLELTQAPWTFEAGEIRNARPLDLPPGAYDVRIAGRVKEAYPTARVVKLDLVAGDLLLGRRYLREDEALAPIELLLPAGARRLVLTGTGIQGKGAVEAVEIVPRSVVRLGERDLLPWPRQPQEDLYRLESEGVRVTALDFVTEASHDFLIDAAARFVVEAAARASVRVVIVRSSPSDADVFEWHRRRIPLGRAPSLALELPAEEGLSVAGLRFVPVRLETPSGRIRFSAAAGTPP